MEYLIKKYSKYYNKTLSGISSRALQIILNYSWPGNVRELENVIERSIILADDNQPLSYRHLFTIDGSIREDSLMSLNELGTLTENRKSNSMKDSSDDMVIENEALSIWSEGVVERENLTLDDIENALFTAAYKSCNGNFSKAADKLGITRAQFSYRAKKLELK